jgi:hypothetical protein
MDGGKAWFLMGLGIYNFSQSIAINLKLIFVFN